MTPDAPLTTISPQAPETPRPWGMRNRRPGMMLDLRLKNGDRTSLPYFELKARLTGGVLRLFFDDATVVVRGRHLGAAYDLLIDHATAYLQEQHASPMLLRPEEPFIERIEFEPPNREMLARRPFG